MLAIVTVDNCDGGRADPDSTERPARGDFILGVAVAGACRGPRARDDGHVATGEIERLARERLGFEQLRPGQLPAVEALVAGRDVLAVLPTGAGKSAIYELAGLLRAGPTVVVSPLIALEDDQLAHLRSAGLHAIVLNSRQSAGKRAAALLASCRPDTFVFLSPEQLANPETRQTLARAAPGLFVVDEAHLISQWGHDFRPDYMLLGAQAEALGAPVRLALTATAAPPVRQEIVRRLGLREPRDRDRRLRPAEHLPVGPPGADRHGKAAAARARGDRVRAGPGIVYAATHAERAGGARHARGGRGAGDALPRRAGRARPAGRDGGVPRRHGPGHRGHGRVRDGDRQAGRALGRALRPAARRPTRTTRSSGGPAGTGRRRRRGCSTGTRTSRPRGT